MAPEAPVPPQNLDAEENILGAMMISATAIDVVADIVRPEDFYRSANGKIFAAAVGLANSNEPVDAISLSNELDKRGLLGDVGGKARVHEIARIVPVAGNAGHYAKIVRTLALRRALIQKGGEISNLGWIGEGEIEDLLAEAEGKITDATTRSYDSDFSPLGAESDAFESTLTEAVETGVRVTGLKTNFVDLDTMLSGFYPGTLNILAARPQVGKSMMAQNISENIASKRKPVAFFSLEMSAEELRLRSLARRTRISTKDLRTGAITAEQLETVKTKLGHIRQLPLYVEDNASISMVELRARARRLQRTKGLELLVVDYLQLMIAGDSNQKTNDQVAQITRSLKLMAKELQIPVLALSQLNRNLESRENKRPTLADLRDSGSIEQDADTVLFLYREDLYKTTDVEDAGNTELIVAKNRMGEIGTVHLVFSGRRQEFLNIAKGLND